MNNDLANAIVSIGNPLVIGEAEKKIEDSWTAKLLYYQDILKGRLKQVEG